MKEKFNKYICDFEGCRHRNEENVCCLFNQENCVYYRTLQALNGYKAIAKRCDDCKKIKELEAQIEKMKRCEICKEYTSGSCNYHSYSQQVCKENGMKLFKLKEIKEND
jgi:hypothetical protein